MTKHLYRVFAENDAGTAGESPPFYAESEEEAKALYLKTPFPLNIVKIVKED